MASPRRKRNTVQVFLQKGLDFYREGDPMAAIGAWKLAAELEIGRAANGEEPIPFANDQVTDGADADRSLQQIPTRQIEMPSLAAEPTRQVALRTTMLGIGVPTRQVRSIEALLDNPDTIAEQHPVGRMAETVAGPDPYDLMPELAPPESVDDGNADEFFGSSFDSSPPSVEDRFRDFDAAPPSGNHANGTGSRNTPLELAINNVRDKVEAMIEQCRVAFENGHIEQACEAAEHALQESSQSSLSEVTELVRSGRSLLENVFIHHIGDLNRTPRITRDLKQIKSENLDHTAGFLLSFIDGMTPLEMVLDATGMSRFEAMRSISRLRRMGLINLQ